MQAWEQLQSTLNGFYNTAYNAARAGILNESAEMRKEAMKRSAAMGVGGSGSQEAGAMNQINKSTIGTLGNMLSQNQLALAGATANAFENDQARRFQDMLIQRNRRWQNDDFVRDSIGNLMSAPFAGFGAGIGKTAGANLASDWFLPKK